MQEAPVKRPDGGPRHWVDGDPRDFALRPEPEDGRVVVYWRTATTLEEAAALRDAYAQYLWASRVSRILSRSGRTVTGRALADALEVSADTVSRWLRGEDSVSRGRMHQVATALDDMSVIPSAGEIRELPPTRPTDAGKPGPAHAENIIRLR